jgi:aminomethyltransferase
VTADEAAVPPLRRTALWGTHRAAGARLIEFGGWEMPVQYGSIIEEHRAVRERAGLFDLSHMGELWVEGPAAGDGLAWALASDPRSLSIGRAQYSLLCAPDGGIIDDLIVYRTAETTFLVVPNAANAGTVGAELQARLAGFHASVDDASARTSLVAIQGPLARRMLEPHTDAALAELRYYAITRGAVAGVPAWVARTGYTGEDGFELFVDRDAGPAVWSALLKAGTSEGLVACGLGARDTLRLEAGMPLYGNELDRQTTPFEAGLGRVVKLDKPGGFVGREALAQAAAAPQARTLVGLEVRDRGIARHGYPTYRIGEPEASGVVTSGTQSPTLGRPIAMAYLPPEAAQAGTMVEIGIRAARVPAAVVALPFYRRPA